jgi:hypothetical protein
MYGFGSKREVWHGYALQTKNGLIRRDLYINKNSRIAQKGGMKRLARHIITGDPDVPMSSHLFKQFSLAKKKQKEIAKKNTGDVYKKDKYGEKYAPGQLVLAIDSKDKWNDAEVITLEIDKYTDIIKSWKVKFTNGVDKDMAVIVPSGSREGMNFQKRMPNGQYMSVKVPVGYRGGDMFRVNMLITITNPDKIHPIISQDYPNKINPCLMCNKILSKYTDIKTIQQQHTLLRPYRAVAKDDHQREADARVVSRSKPRSYKLPTYLGFDESKFVPNPALLKGGAAVVDPETWSLAIQQTKHTSYGDMKRGTDGELYFINQYVRVLCKTDDGDEWHNAQVIKFNQSHNFVAGSREQWIVKFTSGPCEDTKQKVTNPYEIYPIISSLYKNRLNPCLECKKCFTPAHISSNIPLALPAAEDRHTAELLESRERARESLRGSS